MSFAPIHLTKLDFKIEEESLAALLKEMDREVNYEHQLLSNDQDPEAILQRHQVIKDFFYDYFNWY